MLYSILALAAGIADAGQPAPAAQPAPAGAVAPAVSVAELRHALSGEWEGALEYRDYRTDRITMLPVRTTIHSVGDGVTQMRTSRFDEGARRAPVWTTTVSGFVGADGRLTSTFFRAGRPVEVESDNAALQRYESPASWTIVYTQTGSDNDAPAEIRISETRDGDELRAVKEVRPLDPPGAAWTVRNQLRLRRAETPER